MAHVLILTKGTAGDLVPFLAAGSALHGKGHDVTFVSHCAYRPLVEGTGVKFVPVDDADEWRLFLEDIHLFNTPRGMPLFFRRHCLPRVSRECKILEQHCAAADTVLLTRHMASLADLLIADKLRLPLVRMFTAPSQVMTFNLLEGLLQELLRGGTFANGDNEGVTTTHDWGSLLRRPVLNLGNWPEWFGTGESAARTSVTPVGFLSYGPAETGEIPPNVRLVCAQENSPVLITAGTGHFLGQEFHSAAVEGCVRTGRKALLVSRYREAVPEGLPDSITWVPYLPFASIMPSVAVVIHHGGMGTIARAITAGIPQLILAYGADRPDNAKRLENLGVAKHLPPAAWTPANVSSALDWLLSSPSVRQQCSYLSRRVSQQESCEYVCHLITEIVQRPSVTV